MVEIQLDDALKQKAIKLARNTYIDSDEDVAVDDDAEFSETADGVWVSAWLWVPKEELLEN